jgi:hypothetical protein
MRTDVDLAREEKRDNHVTELSESLGTHGMRNSLGK